MIEWGPIIQKGAEALAKPVIDAAISNAPKILKVKKPYETLDFEPHFKYAYEKCTRLKTLYSRDSAIDLLQNYVPLKFSNKNDSIDDYDLIDEIFKRRHIVISSVGGGGKTMFMRYFWISCFVNARGKIPIFVELRRFNDIETDDFGTFVFHSAVSNANSSSRDLFESCISEGQFIFIFDGFDEISKSRRDIVEKYIINLSLAMHYNIIVVSGRPDTRFDSWQAFTTYGVCPFSKEQAVQLINIIDVGKKQQNNDLIALLDTNLYNTHESFFSRPLLIIMMLISYRYHRNIQAKLHLFYSQSFEALFHAHDSLKDRFTRQRHTNLDIQEFKTVFSWFCLLTYAEQSFEFEKSEAITYLKKSVSKSLIKVDADALLQDIEESTCLLQTDGIILTFTHRSFQEYFTAYCLSFLKREWVAKFINKISDRIGDNVIPMLYDINRNLAEQAYLIPEITALETQSATFRAEKTVMSYLDMSAYEILIFCRGKGQLNIGFGVAHLDRRIDFLFNVIDQIATLKEANETNKRRSRTKTSSSSNTKDSDRAALADLLNKHYQNLIGKTCVIIVNSNHVEIQSSTSTNKATHICTDQQGNEIINWLESSSFFRELVNSFHNKFKHACEVRSVAIRSDKSISELFERLDD
jgi:hypothetical protein